MMQVLVKNAENGLTVSIIHQTAQNTFNYLVQKLKKNTSNSISQFPSTFPQPSNLKIFSETSSKLFSIKLINENLETTNKNFLLTSSSFTKETSTLPRRNANMCLF
jgi:hypothetical protein